MQQGSDHTSESGLGAVAMQQLGAANNPANQTDRPQPFSLLRRIFITSSLATVLTAALLIFLYWQDQLTEHQKIAAQENEDTGIYLMHLLDDRLDAFIATTQGPNILALQVNQDARDFAISLARELDSEVYREHHIVKLKIYNKSGITLFSTVRQEIGGACDCPELLATAQMGTKTYQLKFHNTFFGSGGELHNRHIEVSTLPLLHAGKITGIFEIYADATPIITRIYGKLTEIFFIVFGIFTVLYAALFLIARRADLAIASDNLKLRESEARLSSTINSALDGIISIDSENRLIGFNPAAEAIFGWKKEEILGQSIVELLIPKRYRKAHQQGLAHFMQGGAAHVMGSRIELAALRRDGSEFPIELTILPVSSANQLNFTAYIRDIAERRQIEEELLNSRSFHQSVTDAIGQIGIGLCIVDANYQISFMNPVMKDWFGEQTGKPCHAALCDLTGRCSYCKLDQVISLNQIVRYAPTLPDGRIFDAIATPILSPDGKTSKLEVIRDVTELRKSEQELRIAAKAFDSQEGIFITDVDSIIQRVNQAFVNTTGYSAEEVVGKTPSILKSGKHDAPFYQAIRLALQQDGHWQGEVWNRRKSGEIYPEWQTISAVRGTEGEITHFVSVFTDISIRKKTEALIENLDFYDPLTQLPNRKLLLDRLHQALALSMRTGHQGALLFVDLDDFKSINDSRGHPVGDQFLIEVACRLKNCIREGDTIARLGGDEFVVLLENLDDDAQDAATQAEAVGEKIRGIIGQPYHIIDHEQLAHDLYSTACIGLTLFCGTQFSMEELLKRADVALNQAKSAGRNSLCFFDPDIQQAVSARVALESELRHALSEPDQFVLYYQAQVDSANHLIGAEALVRWHHPQRGIVPPVEFIPLAEETGLILPLGYWVLQTACRQLAEWSGRPSTEHLTVAVNISAKQFRLPTFVEEVMALVEHFGVNPARLKLEVTESLLLNNVEEIVTKMVMLKEHGISFSLDDFGTGYSSLSYLKRLPLYQLKIDQSFVRDILTDNNDSAIAKMIVALAKSMNLTVISEGVETKAQREFLEQHGCHTFQGYLFSKPVPVEEFEKLITEYALGLVGQ